MPKRAVALGPLDIKRAVHPGDDDKNHWIAVGGVSGLLLQITSSNSKSWLLRTLVGGRRRAIGLGPYPEISLVDARDRAREAKAKIATGIDPVEERKAVRAALAAQASRGLTFADAVDKYLAAKASEFGNEKHRKQWRSTLDNYAAPEIGKMLVSEVAAQDVLRVLAPIWATKTETATRLRQRIEAVLAWSTVAGHRTGDNPARWSGNLKELLPKPSKVAVKDNQPAVAIGDLTGWWRGLAARDGMGAQALRFLTLCAARSGEVRGATWDEIDMEAGLWVIPASRMKAGKEHRVPMPAEAVALLKALPRMAGSEFVFPATRGGALSDMSISAVMRRMQEDEGKAGRVGWLDPRSGRPAVPHGLRSTFRDWAAEQGIDRDVAEMALAHTVGGAVERAYRRSDMMERRRSVMEAWAARLCGYETGRVVPIRAANYNTD